MTSWHTTFFCDAYLCTLAKSFVPYDQAKNPVGILVRSKLSALNSTVFGMHERDMVTLEEPVKPCAVCLHQTNGLGPVSSI